MTDDCASVRGGTGLRGDGAGGFESTPGVAVVQRIAEAAGRSPVDLPALNETVDVDALDALLSGGGEWPAISFRHADRTVRVDASGSVAVAASGAGFDDEWTHVSPVEAADEHGLVVNVTTAIADRSGRDPVRVRSELEEVVDLDALDRLNRPRPNGVSRTGATVRFPSQGYDVVVTPDGSIAVGSTLTRLGRTGGNVLLAGAVPDAIVDVASATLLGEGDRRRVFALLDRDVDVVGERLSPADATAPVRVIDYASTSRSGAADRPSPSPRTIVETADSLEDVPGAIERVLRTLRADGPRLEPAAVRLCVDSLRPVLEDGAADGAAFVESIVETVAETGALAHYVLPVDRETPAVAAIEDRFDATVELRAGEGAPEQRWHLRDGDVTTEWFPLDDHS